LVGVLVGSAIVGILVLGLTNAFQDMIKGGNTQKMRSQIENFHAELRSVLSSKAVCTNTLRGLSMDPAATYAITNILAADNSVLYTLGKPYGDMTFTLKSISLSGYSDTTPPAGTIMMRVNYQTVGNVFGAQVLQRSIMIETQKDAGNILYSCVAMAAMSDGIWQVVNNPPRWDIFYTGGYVGIGTSSPTGRLDINTTGNEALVLRGPANQLYFQDTSPNPGQIPGLKWNMDNGRYNLQLINQPPETDCIPCTIATPISVDIVRSSPSFGSISFSNVGIGTLSPAVPFHLVGGDMLLADLAGKPMHMIFDATPAGGSRWILGAGDPVNGWGAATGFAIYNMSSAPGSQVPFAVTAGGIVGIGFNWMTATPQYTLDVSGDINSTTALRVGGTKVCDGGGCASASDARLKENIEPLGESLDKLLKLHGVSYTFKDPARFRGGRQLGLIAQEVESVYPEVVETDSQSGMKSVAYDHLVAAVIEAMRGLQAENAALKQRIENLERAALY
jgi:hypothetical protein